MSQKHCPSCGYTEADARFHMDHYRCKNAGNAPWEKKADAPYSKPTPVAVLPDTKTGETK